MPITSKIWMIRGTALVCWLLISACTSAPHSKPRAPINEPVDAFEAVGQPEKSAGAPQSDNDNLSNDVQRLQNARQTYRYAQQRRAAEVRRHQANCRARPNSKKVQIQDGSGDPNATYCQPATQSESSDSP